MKKGCEKIYTPVTARDSWPRDCCMRNSPFSYLLLWSMIENCMQQLLLTNSISMKEGLFF